MKSKTYEVIGWTSTDPHTTSCFYRVEPTDAIKQAIINDIRKNGFMLDRTFCLSPVLNTGEVVEIEYELHEELIRSAYGLSEEQYADYYERVVKNPSVDLADQSCFSCEYPMKKIVWITDDAFDDFKDCILNGTSNVDIIPKDFIRLKKGDVIRYTSEDESKFFEVTVKEFISDFTLSHLSDIEKIQKFNTQNFLSGILQEKNDCLDLKSLSYRHEGLSGEDICDDFRRVYHNELQTFFVFDFDCGINVIVFDKGSAFEQTILEKPDDIPLEDKVWENLKDSYEQSIREEEQKREEQRQKILKLKEKIAAKKKDSDE